MVCIWHTKQYVHKSKDSMVKYSNCTTCKEQSKQEENVGGQQKGPQSIEEQPHLFL